MTTKKKTPSRRPAQDRPAQGRPAEARRRPRRDEPQPKQEERVEESSEESFPTSDAPAWTGGVVEDPTKPVPRPEELQEGRRRDDD